MPKPNPTRPLGAVARDHPLPRLRRRQRLRASNPFRPFCSERCRSADLGAWASEGYRVPARPTAPDGDDSELLPD